MAKHKERYKVAYDHVDNCHIMHHSKHRSLTAAHTKAYKLLTATKWRKAQATRVYITDLKTGKRWKVDP